MTYPYPPPRARSGWHPLVWVAIAIGSCFVLLVLIAVAIPIFINVRGGPSGPQPQQVAANVGAGALHVGEVRHGGSVDTSVLAVRKYPTRAGRPSASGTEWLGIRVNVCWHADASLQTPAITWQNFVAVDAAGRGFLPAHAYDDYPSPQFPQTDPVRPGQCDSGWISTPVPIGTSANITRVVLTDQGTAVAEWLS